MTHLHAEKRVNKNGVAVTKHVLPQKPVGAGRKPIPAPAPVSAERGKAVTREALQRLRSAGVELRNNSYATKNLYHLANKNPELLERVVVRAETADSAEKKIWDYNLSTTARHRAGNDPYDYSSAYEIDLKAIPVAVTVVPAGDHFEYTVSQRIHESTMALSEDNREPNTVAAAVIAMEYDRRFSGSYMYKFDAEKYAGEISRIAERPEEVASILEELIKRETLDAGTIEAILDVSAASLRDGAL